MRCWRVLGAAAARLSLNPEPVQPYSSRVICKKLNSTHNCIIAASVIFLTVKTFETLAMGNIVSSVGLRLGIWELFSTPYSPRQMTLSMYTMLAVTALYK